MTYDSGLLSDGHFEWVLKNIAYDAHRRTLMGEIVSNTAQLKKVNEERIRQAIKENPNSTKALIARETGLSLATCNNILNEMVEMGEIIASEMTPSSGGRPATPFIYNKEYKNAICMYINTEGNVKVMAFAIVNAVGEILEEERLLLDYIDADVIDQQLGIRLNRYPKVSTVGIGIPGAVQDGIIDPCDVSELVNVNLQEQLTQKYGIEIIIENDMNLISYGYYMKHIVENGVESPKSLAIIYFSKNNLPGCGVVIEGSLLKGNTMFAGEVSYVSLAYGLTRDDQNRLLNNPSDFPEIAAKSICSVIAMINPQTIVLIGSLLENADLGEIEARFLDVIPAKHMSQLVVSNEIHDFYMKGLIRMTINSLSCGIPVI